MKQLQLQVKDLNTQYQLMKAKNEAEITEFKSKTTAMETEIQNNVKTLLQERERSTRWMTADCETTDIQLRKEREQS